MKKIFFTIFIVFLTINSFAQTVTYGLKGGVNLASQTIKPQIGGKRDKLVGFHAGAIVDVDFGNVSVQPGLLYTVKGWQSKNDLVDANQQSLGSSTDKYKFNYVEVPVNVLYNVKASENTKVFLGGGPYIAYGVSAKGTVNMAASGTATTNSVTYNLFDSTSGFKRFDYGLGLTAGLAHNSFLVSINADLGFANLTSAPNVKIKNNVLGLSIGYIFK